MAPPSIVARAVNATAATTCEHCGATIATEDLQQGLAVRVDGRLTCSQCIDALPGTAVARINQLRAMRGFGVTTYAMPRKRHPALVGYTFTTASNISAHRRQIERGEAFSAPPLPNTAPIQPRSMKPPTRRGPSTAMIAAACVVLAVVAGTGWYLTTRADGEARSAAPAGVPTTPTPQATRLRTDLPVEPLAAWALVESDAASDGALRRVVADEVIADADRQLAAADAASGRGSVGEAKRLLAAITLPDHLWFRATQTRARERRAALDAPPTDAPESPGREPAPPSDDVPALATVVPPVPIEPPVEATPVGPVEPAALPTPASASGGERWLIAAKEWWNTDERGEWRKTSTGVKLDRATGDLVASVELGGGRYQVWIDARAEAADGFLHLSLGQHKSELFAPTPARSSKWHCLIREVTLSPGTTAVRLVASGKGWQVDRLWLAGVDVSPPSGDDVPAGAGAATYTPVPPRPPAPFIAAWEPRFIGQGAELDPLDERQRVPNRPGGIDRVFASAALRAKRKHALTLDLNGVDALDGGLVVVMHPNRADRLQITATIVDQDDKRWQGVLELSDDWQALAIDLRPVGLALDRLASLTLEDVAPNLTTPFLLGPVTVAANVAPTPDIIELRPPALIVPSARSFDEQLSAVALKRRSRNWRREFDPARVKVLVGQQLLLGEWDTLARAAIKDVIGLKEDEALPGRTLEALVMQDLWLNAMFDGDQPILDRQKHDLVLIATAGVEFPIGLSEPQAFVNFWKKAIDVCVEHGVMPVVVLGPSKVDPESKIDAERLWQDVELYVRTKRPGVPMIDLRPARARDFRHFLPGQTALAARLFADGYRELVGRMRWLQKATK